MKRNFDKVSLKASKLITNTYSTSFSIGVRCLGKELRAPIYAVYGYVRLADEIVDSFEGYDKKALLEQLEEETFSSIKNKISLNPVLNSFQKAVNDFNIDLELIRQFLGSMKMDLKDHVYNEEDYDLYIYGSAEVVGLMCLKVFCKGDQTEYEKLKYPAQKLGSAFQKLNFLRDLHSDHHDLKRMYFPNTDFNSFSLETKTQIENDILTDFEAGYQGIVMLPADARFGTYVAYRYYKELFKRAKRTSVEHILEKRVRVPNRKKYAIFVESALKHSMGLI